MKSQLPGFKTFSVERTEKYFGLQSTTSCIGIENPKPKVQIPGLAEHSAVEISAQEVRTQIRKLTFLLIPYNLLKSGLFPRFQES